MRPVRERESPVSKMKKAVQVTCMAVVVAAVSLPVGATTRTWVDNPGSTDWKFSSNWSPAGTPAESDNLRVLTGAPTAGTYIRIDRGGSILIRGVSLTSSEGFYVAQYDEGSARIEGGGDIICRYANVGTKTGSVGVMEVDGTGSTWQVDHQLRVGNAGDGTLKITDQAVVTCDGGGILAVGLDSYGRLLVDGDGSVWNVNGSYLSVGYVAGAEMTIRNGGAVYSTQGYVGSGWAADATAVIEGVGSRWECSSWLFTGKSGIGGITVRGGGRLSSAGGSIADKPGSRGRVTVEGNSSIWDSSGDIFVGGGMFRAGGQGRLDVNPGAEVHTREELTVYPSGAIAIGLNGSAAGEYGQILIDDIATFGGTLEIHVAGGAALTPGESMDIITYGQTSTSFDDVEMFGDMGAGHFEWTYGADALELTYVPEPATMVMAALGGLALLHRRRKR